MKKIIFNSDSERIKFECKLIDCIFNILVKEAYVNQEDLTYYEENEDCVYNTELGEKISLDILNSLNGFSEVKNN
jgi:hypothetical protein